MQVTMARDYLRFAGLARNKKTSSEYEPDNG